MNIIYTHFYSRATVSEDIKIRAEFLDIFEIFFELRQGKKRGRRNGKRGIKWRKRRRHKEMWRRRNVDWMKEKGDAGG